MLFEKIIIWIVQRRWLFGIIAFIAVLVYLFVSYTLVILTVSTPQGTTAASITTLDNSGSSGIVIRIGQFALIPRNTVLATATSGNLQTSTDITPLPWIGIKSINLTVEHDKNVDKIAGDNLGCSLYNQRKNQLSSFSCTNPFGLFQYVTSTKDGVPWKNKPSLSFPQAYTATTYNNGVIGITNSTEPYLFYADTSNNSLNELQLPVDNMSSDQLRAVSVYADTADRSRPHFLLIDNLTGTVYLGQQTDSHNVTYRHFTYDAKDASDIFTRGTCTLVNTTAYCYYGESSYSSDSEGETTYRKKIQSNTLVTIDFSQQKPTTKTYTIPKVQTIDTLYADIEGNVYGMDGTTLFILSIQNNSQVIDRKIVATNVDFTSAGQKVLYTSKNKVYEYIPKTKTTYMRFYSDNLRPSNIDQFKDTVLINAYIKGALDSTKLHTYKLLNDPNTASEKRLVDIIPTNPDTSGTDIIDMDYIGTEIHIVLPAYVKYDASNKIVQDDQRYSEAGQEARNYLSNLIPSFNKYHLTFSRAETK